MLTRTLALELAPMQINVNSLGPGMVLTPFNQPAIDDPELLDEQVQSIPLKRAAEPSEIARLAVFLASADSDYVTGSTYFMDGGLMMNVASELDRPRAERDLADSLEDDQCRLYRNRCTIGQLTRMPTEP